MSFEGEFAHYEPLRRLLSSQKVQAFVDSLKIRDVATNATDVVKQVVKEKDLDDLCTVQPDLILAIDGSVAEAPVTKGFP
ncbi:MAG: hypothetical protein IKG78_07015, partial [Fibrobacter sp.]